MRISTFDLIDSIFLKKDPSSFHKERKMIGRFLITSVVVLAAFCAQSPISVAQTAVEAVTEKSVAGTVRQQQWLASSLETRVRLSEALGEDGARLMAKSKGLETLYDGVGRTIPQGPDQVYRAIDGRVIVYEAKGGTGQLGHAYGHPQGSSEWAVESAKRVLRSPNAAQVEKQAAQKILEAADKGLLEVHVIRTKHVLGEPFAAVLENVTQTNDATKQIARSALDDLVRAGVNASDDVARAGGVTASKVVAAEASSTATTSAKALSKTSNVVAASSQASKTVEVTSRVASSAKQLSQAAPKAIEASGQAARITEASGVAARVLPVVGQAAGAAGVVVDVAVRTSDAIKTEEKFSKGQITTKQREVAHAGNAAGIVGGLGGVAAGAEVGAIAGSIGGPVGVAVGGVVGGVGGYFGGSAAAEHAAKSAVRYVHKQGTTIQSSANQAWRNSYRWMKRAQKTSLSTFGF